MELLTAELRASLPPLYSQESNEDPVVHCKFFTPGQTGRGLPLKELDEDDFRLFGYVCGHEAEWGYFVLSELESVCGPGGLTIERDLHFTPGPFSEVISRYRQEHGQ